MSTRNFKDLHKANDVVVLYFSTPASQWGETVSVTIPAADAQKLLRKLEETVQSARPAH
jgi:phosphotransferase system HPr-like phosphotransfer protein